MRLKTIIGIDSIYYFVIERIENNSIKKRYKLTPKNFRIWKYKYDQGQDWRPSSKLKFYDLKLFSIIIIYIDDKLEMDVLISSLIIK